MADGRFWCEADIAGRAAGSTRSLVTHLDRWPRDFGAMQHVKRAAILTYKCPIGYSITSSASANKLGGTVMPSALAVLRLTTISNLVGCTMGRSAGFSPLRTSPT